MSSVFRTSEISRLDPRWDFVKIRSLELSQRGKRTPRLVPLRERSSRAHCRDADNYVTLQSDVFAQLKIIMSHRARRFFPVKFKVRPRFFLPSPLRFVWPGRTRRARKKGMRAPCYHGAVELFIN